MEQRYYLYWLHNEQHKDLLTEGYVGITKNISQRLNEHRWRGLDHTILCVGSKRYCCEMEYKLRPKANIGLNSSPGGGSKGMSGKTHSDEYKQRRREMWLNNNPRKFWTEKSKELAMNTRSRTWTVTFPDGHTEVVKNLRKFCREHNLDQGSLYKVAKAQQGRTQNKGYKAIPGGVISQLVQT